MAKRRQSIVSILDSIAAEFGIDAKAFRAVAQIESSLKPSARTGSYHGVFQLSKSEFKKHGGGNIYNAEDNARAGASKWKADAQYFKKTVGRDPSSTECISCISKGAPAWPLMRLIPKAQHKRTSGRFIATKRLGTVVSRAATLMPRRRRGATFRKRSAPDLAVSRT
jgi:hypothetical protein